MASTAKELSAATLETQDAPVDLRGPFSYETVADNTVKLGPEKLEAMFNGLSIDGINVSDNEHALAVLRQAMANVAGHATLRWVALDRGFLDGKLLWRVEHELGHREGSGAVDHPPGR